MILFLICTALAVVIDQLTKYFALASLAPDGSIDVIRGVFRFTYVENRGAAFGSLSDSRWVFLISSTVLIVAIAVFVIARRPKNKLFLISLALVTGGGIGNMIDRLSRGFVVDFLDFCAFPQLWRWVFNAADVFVCVGAPIAVIMYYKLYGDSKSGKSGAVPTKDGQTGESDE